MKKNTMLNISLLLILFSFSSLYAQEVEMGLSLDFYTGIWTSGTIDEGLTFSSTYNVAYYQRIWKDAFKLGVGMGIWIPRWPYDTDWEVGFSDYLGYGTTLLYPFRFTETRNETISNFYLKGNVGYHLPIIWGYWADYKPGRVWLAESWGGLVWGAGCGVEFKKIFFIEAIYHEYDFGWTLWRPDLGNKFDYDCGFNTYALNLGFRFSY